MKTKIDAGTLWTMAAMSILSSVEPCTAPSEKEEIIRRADIIVGLLGDIRILKANNSYIPAYPEERWPFAMSQDEMMNAASRYAGNYDSHNDNRLDIDTLILILENEEIEKRFRLSRVSKKVSRNVLWPF